MTVDPSLRRRRRQTNAPKLVPKAGSHASSLMLWTLCFWSCSFLFILTPSSGADATQDHTATGPTSHGFRFRLRSSLESLRLWILGFLCSIRPGGRGPGPTNNTMPLCVWAWLLLGLLLTAAVTTTDCPTWLRRSAASAAHCKCHW